MRKHLLMIVATSVMLLALLAPSIANAADETGSTARWPWSGYWWPMLNTDTNLYDDAGPLAKYDTYLKSTTGTAGGAQAWEKANHFTADAKNDWWGHCHAWSAASILTTEPGAVTAGGVSFTANDTKGLVTELYYSPQLNWLSGKRVDDATDTSSAAYKDIAPAWMDYLLRYYVRYYKFPFVMDINANAEVWNFPVFAYSRHTVDYAGGVQDVTTQVWYSSPEYGTTGTRYFSRTYTYRLTAGQLGVWTGTSVDNHPDFAWVPTGRNTMPHVNGATVSAILGGQAV